MSDTYTIYSAQVFRWHKKFQDGITNHKDCSHPGQPKTGVINANITAVVGLFKQDDRLILKNIAHSVGILSGSAQKILTRQLKHGKVSARCAPIA